MPNILKHFFRPQVGSYTFPPADEIQVEEEKTDQPEEEHLPDEGDHAEESGQDSERPGPDPGQGAAAMFSYAKVQSETIIAQAKSEGEALLEEYRRQAMEEAQQLREEAKQEGFRQGYADGLVKAQAESRARQDEEFQKQAGQIRDFLQRATQAREELMEQAREELCDLSIAVAEKVIHVSLKSSREVILRMVQMATERLKRREWVRIYIGGCDSWELAQISPELTASLAGLSDHIKLIPMADDESGTCIIEMPDEIIDASVSTQLDNLKGILRGG